MPFFYDDHPKPITRRQLLSQGFLTFSASTFLPSLFSLVREASASDCGGGQAKRFIPFLVVDCQGGAAMPGNFLVGKEGGPEDLLSSYDRLGWDPRESQSLDKQFGVPLSAKTSRLLTGLVNATSVDARSRLRMGSFCHVAQDDTSTNTLSAVSLVVKAGYRGSSISRALGTRNTDSGGNSQAVLSDPAMKPVFISSINDVVGALGFGSAGPFANMTTDFAKSLLGTSWDLSAEQAKKFEQSDKGKLLKSLAECSAKENKALLDSSLNVDPRVVANFQQIYAINQNTQPNTQQAVFATLVMNLLTSQTGPSVLTIGGCDYHDNTSTTGDNKDQEIGTEIGRAVEAAHRLKTPLFFQILTDGGVSNRQGSRIWVSDSGDRCMTVVGYYDPAGPVTMRRTQVGHYTDGQVAERGTLLGGSQYKVACAVFANYLRLMVKDQAEFEKEFDKVVPRGTFNSFAELETTFLFS